MMLPNSSIHPPSVSGGGSGLHYDTASGTLSARRLEVEEIKDLEQLIQGDLLVRSKQPAVVWRHEDRRRRTPS